MGTISNALGSIREAPSHPYPRKIRLSDTAEEYIAGLAVDLLLDEVQLWQLPSSLLQLWEFGFQTGRESRQAEIDYLDHECSRYYYEFCRRQSRPLRDPNSPSFAELEDRRGHPENAARVRRFMADLFAEVSL